MTREPTLERVVRETVAYLERDLRAPEGGFYTAEDADSEGVEGKFYVWTPAEVRAALRPPASTRGGRRRSCAATTSATRATGTIRTATGRRAPASCTSSIGRATPTRSALIADAKAALLAARAKRVRPGLDDKVLAGNNGMAIAGLAEAGRIFGDAAFVDGARRTAEFVLAHMTEASRGRLLRTFKAGAARLPGTLDDHAHVADGLIALYEATGEARWLEEAHRLTRLSVGLFWDARERALLHDGGRRPGPDAAAGVDVRLGGAVGHERHRREPDPPRRRLRRKARGSTSPRRRCTRTTRARSRIRSASPTCSTRSICGSSARRRSCSPAPTSTRARARRRRRSICRTA